MKEVDELKKKLEQAKTDLQDMPSPMKAEPSEDNPFRDMVKTFSEETLATPMEITDSQ